MPRIPTLLFVALAPLAVSGCFPNPDYHDLPDQRVIGHHTETLTAVAIADLTQPSTAEKSETITQLAAAGETGIRVRVQLARKLAQAPELEIRRYISDLGVPTGIAVLDRTGTTDWTRLVIERTTLTAPDCDKMITPNESWTFATDTHSNPRPSMAFGCATYTNLTRMIADPADLATPRPLDTPDAAYTNGAMDRYQDNKVTPLRKTTSTKTSGGQ